MVNTVTETDLNHIKLISTDMARFLRCVAPALVFAVAACGSAHTDRAGDGARPRVRVAAASDLNAALPAIVAAFSAAHAADVEVSYGSSGNLYAQLANQAPFDMFFSADAEYPRRLKDGGATLAGGDFEYGIGRIVLWVPEQSPLDIEHEGLRALAAPAVSHVAIANPEHAPYGRAAVAALKHEGLEDAVRPKLVNGENVAQAMQFVQSGAADAGIVAVSLALTPAGRKGRWADIPAGAYPPLRQAGTILKWAADPAAARALRDFIVSPAGRAILLKYGFAQGPAD
jgi:molybdate transport system substrate-binding protein